MIDPIVSIVMPAYNNSQFIGQAISSVQKQLFESWELLVINDGSVDDTQSIIEDIAKTDPRIKIYYHKHNQGLVSTLNHGLAEAKGSLVARLDSDDYWTDPTKLEKQVAFLNDHPGYVLVGTSGQAVSEQGQFLFDLSFPERDEDIRKVLLRRNCFIHSSVMFRTEIVKKLGSYMGTEGYVEDYELWLRLGTHYNFFVLPGNMVSYRINPLGLTQTKSIAQYQAFIALAKKFRGQYPNFYRSYLSMQLKTWFIMLFGIGMLNRVKQQFIK